MPLLFDTKEFLGRRHALVESIRSMYKANQGIIMLIGALENDVYRFRQESSFYYFSGLEEPGLILLLDLDGSSTLFIPNHGKLRAKWAVTSLEKTAISAQEAGVDRIEYLGQLCDGYQVFPFFKTPEYQDLLHTLKNALQQGKSLFTLSPDAPYGYVEQRWMLERIRQCLPELHNTLIDISPIVAQMRRTKSMHELEFIYKAADITSMAHEAAMLDIKPGVAEYQVQATIEFVFTEAGASRPAFPSIVGSGVNSTILHYTANKRTMEHGDLVVVDIGAEYNYYCADITRTYPVSGRFTDRQREIYDIVLETQNYIASIAKAGMWLSNKDQEDKSLNHLARVYLKELGYDQYFPHGLGHFLGLDVHDVGDYREPLESGDVITIEPGIYIREENLGVRIEDDYVITEHGAECLSEDLPKAAEEIEERMQMAVNTEETEERSRYGSRYDA